MKKFILWILIVAAPTGWAVSQGCVAIRNVSGLSPDLLFQKEKPDNGLILNITNRYFEASESYKGDKFLTDTLVTNRLYTLNFTLIKILNKGWSLAVNLPIAANSRNNGADHKGPGTLPRYTTSAFGLGDIRFSVYKWILDPGKNPKGNIQLGLGLKLPTGDFRYQDYFVRNDSTKVLAPVDQAIQLGDGGTGITAELSAFYNLATWVNVYVYGFYLANPREQNGVSNLKGRNATPVQVNNNTTVMSVPDQYTIRSGGNFQYRKFIFTAGLRYEKVTVNDLIGGNKGFRRAASISSVETGINYSIKKSLLFFYVGVPIKNNIIQNKQNDMTPAGFANIVFTLGAQFNL
jgi:hypothetical protein